MTRYIIRRILWAFVLLIAVTFVSYVIFFLTPAHPERLFAGHGADPATIERTKVYFGLDKPWYVQYGRFAYRLLQPWHSNWLGFSFADRQWIRDVVANAAPVTASLVIGGAILWMLIAVPIGILSALRPRSLLDRASMTGVLVGVSLHPVWIGLMAAWLFGYYLGWTPITGYADFFSPPAGTAGGPWQWFYHLILPWCTFAAVFTALYVRMIRANVAETLNEDFVRTARAKGAPEWVVMRSHILRNAMLPIVTMLGMDISVALGGAVFTESIYSLPGLGNALAKSIDGFNLPVAMGVVVFATLCIIFINLIVDLLYAVIDPRIRLA
jgi:peptide/nickel transport system permease protein